MKEQHHSSILASLQYDPSRPTQTLTSIDPRKMEERAKEKLSEGAWYIVPPTTKYQRHPNQKKTQQVLRLLKRRNVKHTPGKPTSLLPPPTNPKPTNRLKQPLNKNNNLQPLRIRPNRLRPSGNKQNLPPVRRSRRLKSRQRAEPPLLPLHGGQHID